MAKEITIQEPIPVQSTKTGPGGGCLMIIVAAITAILTSCSRETSFECISCTTTVSVQRDGQPAESYSYPVSCDTARVGEQIINGPTVTWVFKTECR